MTPLPKGSAAALSPLRDFLHADAARQAAALLEDARHEAAAILQKARGEADAILAQAAAEGETDARAEAGLRSARVRRQAHEAVLSAQNDLLLELQAGVQTAATMVRADPRYPALLERLTERAHTVLGPDATVAESPDGGLTATAGSHSLDLSLATLAAQTLDAMSQEVRELWMQ